MNTANIYSPVIEEENIFKTVFQLYTLENDNVIKKEFFDAKELIKNILPTTQTVSYTHLDVYKRQANT